MLRSPALATRMHHFSMGLAPVAAALLVAGCSTAPQNYRLEAEIGDPLGFPQGATATRGVSRWTIERRVYALGQTRRVLLSAEDSLALDTAVADPSLYDRPTSRSGEECVDTPSIALDVTVDGPPRRLTLECETSPGLEAVLRILFDWPNPASATGERTGD